MSSFLILRSVEPMFHIALLFLFTSAHSASLPERRPVFDDSGDDRRLVSEPIDEG
jgi:hypothetical protein